jgi:hypothetical protein
MAIDLFQGITDERWSIDYDNEKLELEVKRSRCPHCVFAKNIQGFKHKHPWEIFFRFFNELVWFYNITIKNINGGHGDYCANANFLPSDDSYAIELSSFRQQIFDKNQHLALGFYREGISCESPYYRFLCYSKILEIPFNNGREKGCWIDGQIPKLQDELAVTFRDRKLHIFGEKTLGTWLKEDGRDAVAHANIQANNTVRDPNCYQDWDEIKWGNVVMHELAEKAMIEKMGIPTKEH